MADRSFSRQPSSNASRAYFPNSPNLGAPSFPSPFQASNSPRDDDSLFGPDSPWSQGSLTLPPLNPSSNFTSENLPHLNDPLFNPGLPWSQNPNPFAHLSSTSSESEQHYHEPPPSNQQARRSRLQSQYRITSESPDPFDPFLDIPEDTPPRDAMPPTLRSHSSVVDLTASSPRGTVPSSRKRKADTSEAERASKLARPSSSRSAANFDLSNVEYVDLSDEKTGLNLKSEVPPERKLEEIIRDQNQADATKDVKLAEFQCIICMDNPTDLTVTHCGHLFCSECLHQALYAGEKKCCPVCRTVISLPRAAGAKMPKNGVFVLELKFSTRSRKGKQPVRA